MWGWFKWKPRLVPPPKKPDPLDPATYFTGENRPTGTLCTLLAAEMLRNLDAPVKTVDLNKGTNQITGNAYAEHSAKYYEFPSFFYRTYRWRYEGSHRSYDREDFETKDGGGITYDAAEKKYMAAVFKKFLELRTLSESQKREAENQQKALDVIATIFNQPLEKTGE